MSKYIQYKTNDVNVLLCSFSMLVKGVPGDIILWDYRIWSIFVQVMTRLSEKNFCSPSTTLRSFGSPDYFGVFVLQNAYRSMTNLMK